MTAVTVMTHVTIAVETNNKIWDVIPIAYFDDVEIKISSY